MNSFATLTLLMAFTIPIGAGAATGEELWLKNCKMCHGADGSGDSAMGKRLQIPDYRDAEVQAGITNEAARLAIANGLKSESGKQTMLPFGKKLSAEDIELVIAHMRTLTGE